MTNHEEDDGGWPWFPRFRAIPGMFHSLGEDGPFLKCTACDVDLHEASRRYVIERIFRGDEPIVEYAMCMECQDGISKELSHESLSRIQEVFREIDHDQRLSQLRRQLDGDNIDPWIGQCVLTGKHRSDCAGYQVIAVCQGNQLELSAAPLMISDTGIECIMKVLSKKTRDRMEDFLGDTFGMPPEFCEHPDFFPVLL